MENNLTVTDTELSIIQTALLMGVVGIERYVDANGLNSIDDATKLAYVEMRNLYDKLEQQYFGSEKEDKPFN